MAKGDGRGRPSKGKGGKGAATKAFVSQLNGAGGAAEEEIRNDDPLGPRRPPTVPETKHPFTNQLAFIHADVLKTMSRHDASAMFKVPVNPRKLNILNYYEFIQKPMDLGCVRERLTNRYYKCAKECIRDLIQMFANCYFYNHPQSNVVSQAKDLERTMVRRLIDMPEEEEVIPEGQRYRTVSRGSDEMDCGSSIGEQNGVGGSPSQLSDSASTSDKNLRRSLRMPSGGKDLRALQKDDDSSTISSLSDTSSEDEDDDDAHNNGGAGAQRRLDEEDDEVVLLVDEDVAGGRNVVNERGGGGLGEVQAVSDLVSAYLKKSQERRNKRMELLQRQMRCLNEQMNAIRREEAEDAKLLKSGAAIPSTSKGSSKGRTSTGGTTSQKATPAKKKVSGGKGRASSEAKKRKTEKSPLTPEKPAPKKSRPSTASKSPKENPSPPPPKKSRPSTASKSPKEKPSPPPPKKFRPSTASKSPKENPSPPPPSPKEKKMTPDELEELRGKVEILQDAQEVDEILQVISNYDLEDEIDEDGIKYAALPAPCQWELWRVSEKIIQQLERGPATPAESLPPGESEAPIMDACEIVEKSQVSPVQPSHEDRMSLSISSSESEPELPESFEYSTEPEVPESFEFADLEPAENEESLPVPPQSPAENEESLPTFPQSPEENEEPVPTPPQDPAEKSSEKSSESPANAEKTSAINAGGTEPFEVDDEANFIPNYDEEDDDESLLDIY